ncbi:hypothetical protein RhiJN_14656 [Ceratobasidium sp. AG-Ba]|nr:hypothetical protein RhiJN_14656 [Ceratobasidium sp. AG-Ba]
MSYRRQTRSRSRLVLVQPALSLAPSRPTLPSEIINIIFSYSSFGARIKIIRLNRWFNTTYVDILYRDIRISTAPQMLGLYRSRNTVKKLAVTQTFTIAQRLLWEEGWKDIRKRLESIEYICRILEMTTSLVELNILDLNTRFELSGSSEPTFMEEICRRALNPAFLPRLARFTYHGAFQRLQSLYCGRPLEYLNLNVSHYNSDRNPSIFCHPAGVSSVRLSLSTTIFTWADGEAEAGDRVADYLEYCIAAGLGVRHLSVFVSSIFLDPDIYNNSFDSLLLDWVRRFLSKGGSNQLESLGITFSMTHGDKPLNVQHHTIEEIGKVAPSLTYAVLGAPDVQWRRYTSERPMEKAAGLPKWTPCPNHSHPTVLQWWFEALEIRLAEALTDEELDDIAVRVRDNMLIRWPHTLVPSLGVLRNLMRNPPKYVPNSIDLYPQCYH